MLQTGKYSESTIFQTFLIVPPLLFVYIDSRREICEFESVVSEIRTFKNKEKNKDSDQ